MTYSEIKADLETSILRQMAAVEKAKIVMSHTGSDLVAGIVTVQENIDRMRKQVAAIDRIMAKHSLA